MLRLPSLWNGSQPEPQEALRIYVNPARHGPQAHWNWTQATPESDWFAASPRSSQHEMRERTSTRSPKVAVSPPRRSLTFSTGKTLARPRDDRPTRSSFPPQAVGQRAPQDAQGPARPAVGHRTAIFVTAPTPTRASAMDRFAPLHVPVWPPRHVDSPPSGIWWIRRSPRPLHGLGRTL